MRGAAFFYVVVLGLSSSLGIATAQENGDAASHGLVEPSLVKIRATGDTPTTRGVSAIGTGFFVSEQGHILTSEHLITNLVEEHGVIAESITLEVTLNGTKLDLLVSINEAKKEYDLLLIKVDATRNKYQSVAFGDILGAYDETKLGRIFFTSGYPGGTYGVLDFKVSSEGPGGYLLRANRKFGAGQSGSPVYLKGGEVVGVLKGNDGEFGVFVPISYARTLLPVSLVGGESSLGEVISRLDMISGDLGDIKKLMAAFRDDGRLREVEEELTDLEKQRRQLEAERNELKDRIADLDQQLKDAVQQRNAAQTKAASRTTELEEGRRAIAAQQEQLEDMDALIAARESEVRDARRELEALGTQLAINQAELADLKNLMEVQEENHRQSSRELAEARDDLKAERDQLAEEAGRLRAKTTETSAEAVRLKQELAKLASYARCSFASEVDPILGWVAYGKREKWEERLFNVVDDLANPSKKPSAAATPRPGYRVSTKDSQVNVRECFPTADSDGLINDLAPLIDSDYNVTGPGDKLTVQYVVEVGNGYFWAAVRDPDIQPHPGSFKCGTTGSKTEEAICGDAALARLDRDLFRAMRFKSDRAWADKRNTCGSDRVCIEKIYQRRLEEISAESPALTTRVEAN